MTLDEFRRLAETWGGDVERWPEPARAAARRLAGSPEGAAVLAEERRLDLVFAAAPAVDRRRADDVSWRVLQTIADDPAFRLTQRTDSGEAPSRRVGVAGALRWLVPALSLACSVVVGVSLALELPFAGAPSDAVTIIAMMIDSSTVPSDWRLR